MGPREDDGVRTAAVTSPRFPMVRSTCLSIRVTSKGINIFVTFLLKKKVPGPANRSSTILVNHHRHVVGIGIWLVSVFSHQHQLKSHSSMIVVFMGRLLMYLFFVLLTMTLFTAHPRAHWSSYTIMVRTNGSFQNFSWSSSNTRSAGLQFSISLGCVVPNYLKLYKRES